MLRSIVPAMMALLLAASSAHASSIVSPTHVRAPAVAIGPRGDTAVAWERIVSRRAVVEARAGRGPGSLGPIQRFTAGTAAHVAVGDDGTAALLWLERGGTVKTAIARAGHRFGPSQVLERRGPAHRIVGAVVQPGGRVVAAYTAGDKRLKVALAPLGGRFGAPRALAVVGFSSPSIVLDSRDGTVVVAYPTRSRTGADAQAAVTTLAPTAHAFTTPLTLTSSTTAASVPKAVAGPGGTAVTINSTTLSLSRRGLDGTWSTPETFAAQPENSGNQFPEFLSAPTAALLADGSAIPIWWLQVHAPDNGDLLRGEDYAAGQLLTPVNGIASPPSVAAAGNEAFVASTIDGGPVELFTRAAGATIFTPTALGPTGTGDAQLAASGTHVLAAFQRGDRLHLTIVR